MSNMCSVHGVSVWRPRGLLLCAGAAAALMFQGMEPAEAGRFQKPAWKMPSGLYATPRQRKVKRARRARRVTKRRVQPAAPPAEPLIGTNVDENEPLQIVVSLPAQQMTVYKGGIKIATTRISSGKAGYITPAGVFSILQKKRIHHSNLYDWAPMPYMQRLTWSGVALHAGRVPDYPASHGCIRLPHEFARQLFGVTDKGAHVLVTSADSMLDEIQHPKLFQPAVLATIFDPKHLAVADSDQDRPERLDKVDALPVFEGTQRRHVSTGHWHYAEPMNAAWALDDPHYPVFDTRQETLHLFEGREEGPIRILITRRTERERNIDIQAMLNQLGFDVGAPDGQVGRLTRAAIESFQSHNDLPATGVASDELFDQLAKASGGTKLTSGHLYVRRGRKDLFDAPVAIRDESRPLGTHVYTAMHFDTEATRTRWTVVTLKQGQEPDADDVTGDAEILDAVNAVSAEEALDRIDVPDHLRRRIEAILTPGSSLIVSDNGIDPGETNKGMGFIVRTR